MDVLEQLATALADRKRLMDECPVRKSSRFLEVCPECRSTQREGCGLNTQADAILVDVVKELVASQGAKP